MGPPTFFSSLPPRRARRLTPNRQRLEAYDAQPALTIGEKASFGTGGQPVRKDRSEAGRAVLKAEQNQVDASADAELLEKARNVKLYRSFRDVQLIGNLLVGQIIEQQL